jgi:hypothetical protein
MNSKKLESKRDAAMHAAQNCAESLELLLYEVKDLGWPATELNKKIHVAKQHFNLHMRQYERASALISARGPK